MAIKKVLRRNSWEYSDNNRGVYMADDITGAVTGMIPTVLAIGILKRTTDTMLPSRSRNPVGRKIGIAEKKIQLKVGQGKAVVKSRLLRW
jgi:hypothetical protein